MTGIAHTQDLFDLAHAHLERAADRADLDFAAQVRLAASALPVPRLGHKPHTDELTVPEHLSAALVALDEVNPADGPADLQLCAWHVHELRRIHLQAAAS